MVPMGPSIGHVGHPQQHGGPPLQSSQPQPNSVSSNNQSNKSSSASVVSVFFLTICASNLLDFFKIFRSPIMHLSSR